MSKATVSFIIASGMACSALHVAALCVLLVR